MLEWGGQEDYYPPAELEEYKNLLWLSLEQFEEELEQEQKGHAMMHQRVVDSYECRLKGVREAACFRFEALEAALADT